MTRRSPYVIELSAADRAALKQRARAYTAPHHQVMRAKIVLLAAAGVENTVIADRLDVGVQVVVAVVASHAAWAVIGWAIGGVAAVVLVAVKKRR